MSGKKKGILIRLRSRADGEPIAPPELRARLIEDARVAGTNLTAVAVAILAGHYGLPVETSSQRSEPDGDAEQLMLSVPEALRRKIGAAANDKDVTVQREVLGVLSGHYGLELPPRRPPGRRPAVAAA